MKIGIIIHSKTGNTKSVAQKLKEKLEFLGHDATIDMVSAYNDEEYEVQKVRLDSIPKIEGYDLLFLGGPVRGFSLSPILSAYLSQLEGLEGMNAGIFVTHFFPFKWMGATRAIRQLKDICLSKGAKVLETGVVNWSGSNREKQINDLVEKLIKIL